MFIFQFSWCYVFVTQEYKDDNGILWGKVPGLEGLVEPNQTEREKL
jgi:hypothetical protein